MARCCLGHPWKCTEIQNIDVFISYFLSYYGGLHTASPFSSRVHFYVRLLPSDGLLTVDAVEPLSIIDPAHDYTNSGLNRLFWPTFRLKRSRNSSVLLGYSRGSSCEAGVNASLKYQGRILTFSLSFKALHLPAQSCQRILYLFNYFYFSQVNSEALLLLHELKYAALLIALYYSQWSVKNIWKAIY